MGWVSAIDSESQTIWIADAHRDGKRFIVHADEILTAFVELEAVIGGILATTVPPRTRQITATEQFPDFWKK